MTSGRRRSPFLILVALLLLAALACNGLTSVTTSESGIDQSAVVRSVVATVRAQNNADASIRPLTQPGINVDLGLEGVLTTLYDSVNPSVVYVLTNVESFGLGTGSGFVYDGAGHIVTNNHVVAEGDSFEIAFADGSRREAVVVGADVDSDLAVLLVEDLPASAPPIQLGDSRTINVGQLVVALGSPFGQQGSMSLGIISGLGRSLESQRTSGLGGTYSLPQVIQTDAPINPGNSGGPLLNLNGQVVGVNSAISTQTGLNSGVGFAIPVNAVHRIVPALIANGIYDYPFMGITSSSSQITLAQQQAWELPQSSGVYIGGVTLNSPADDAGLVAAGANNLNGDLIVAIDGQPVDNFNELISYLVFETEVGQTIVLTVLRGGELLELSLTLGQRP